MEPKTEHYAPPRIAHINPALQPYELESLRHPLRPTKSYKKKKYLGNPFSARIWSV